MAEAEQVSKTAAFSGTIVGSQATAEGHIPRNVAGAITQIVAEIKQLINTNAQGVTTALATKVDKVSGAALMLLSENLAIKNDIVNLWSQITILNKVGLSLTVAGCKTADVNGVYSFVGGYGSTRIWSRTGTDAIYAIMYNETGWMIVQEVEAGLTELYYSQQNVNQNTSPYDIPALTWLNTWQNADDEPVGADDDSIIVVTDTTA